MKKTKIKNDYFLIIKDFETEKLKTRKSKTQKQSNNFQTHFIMS